MSKPWTKRAIRGVAQPKLIASPRVVTISVSVDGGAKGPLIHWWKCHMLQFLWKTIWNNLKRLRSELPYNPAILLLGSCSEYAKSLNRKYICSLMFIGNAIHNSQELKTTHVLNNWWEKKFLWYLNKGILFSSKKRWNPSVHCYLDDAGGWQDQKMS